MSKAIQGVAMLGAAVALGVGMMMDPALLVSPMMDKLLATLVIGGISMEAGAVADALTQNRGMNITTRQPASFRQIIYGTQRVGGVIVYRSTTGSHHDQYNFIIVLATHEIAAIEALYLDGRRVYFDPTSNGVTTSPDGTAFGGQADGNQYTGPNGQYYNFGGLVYCEARYGNQADGDVITGMTANDPTWAPDGQGNSPYLGGCAYVYLKVEYDAGMFPGEPEIRFTIRGKNNILDPRTGTTGYTSNWALIIADVIVDSTWGLGDNSVNQAQLIAAANVCDEQVTLASGSTESRYACHYHYDTSTSPGNAIQTMMSGAAGRLSRIGGEWYIWPAYWQGPTLSFGTADLAGEVQWTPNRPIADLFNRVTGTYIAPNYPYNVAGNLYDSNGWYDGSIQNNFPFAFEPDNYPEYAADELHGYGTGVDVYLTQDGGIYLPKEIAQPAVLSVAQAQRLAKINLLRNRQQGSGTLTLHLSALQLQPLDVMQFTFAEYGWTNKQLEVVGFHWVLHYGQSGGAPQMMAQVQVQETDQSVYEWSTTEELSVYDVPVAPLAAPYIVPAPTGLTIEDDSTTVESLADGTTVPRVLVSWTPPQDVYVNDGGKIEIQYQFATNSGQPQPVILSPTYDSVTGVYSSAWVDAAAVSGDSTFAFIVGISPVQFQNMNVRIRAVRTNGAASAWVEVDNHPITQKYQQWSTSTPLGPQGSLTGVSEGADGSAFTAQVNNAEMIIAWTAFSIYAPDGTTYNVAANATGQTFSGLTATTTYYFIAWYDIATGAVTIQLIGTSAATLQAQIQQGQADGRIGIALNFAYQTTNSSTLTSAGAPTPPSGGTCFSPDTLVAVRDQGGILFKPISQVRPGECVKTLAGNWRPVWWRSVMRYVGQMVVIPSVGLSTPTHLMWDGAKWAKAEDLYVQRVEYDGWMYNLHVDPLCDEDHSYTLASGRVVHNIFTTV